MEIAFRASGIAEKSLNATEPAAANDIGKREFVPILHALPLDPFSMERLSLAIIMRDGVRTTATVVQKSATGVKRSTKAAVLLEMFPQHDMRSLYCQYGSKIVA